MLAFLTYCTAQYPAAVMDPDPVPGLGRDPDPPIYLERAPFHFNSKRSRKKITVFFSGPVTKALPPPPSSSLVATNFFPDFL